MRGRGVDLMDVRFLLLLRRNGLDEKEARKVSEQRAGEEPGSDVRGIETGLAAAGERVIEGSSRYKKGKGRERGVTASKARREAEGGKTDRRDRRGRALVGSLDRRRTEEPKSQSRTARPRDGQTWGEERKSVNVPLRLAASRPDISG